MKYKYKIIIIIPFILGAVYFLVNLPRTANVILITVCSLRADHLGCYGYERDSSPSIDKLAREGVLFTQAIAQGSETIHSIPSLITSTYPHTHGFSCWHNPYNNRLNSFEFPTLPHLFKKANYHVGVISGAASNEILLKMLGLDEYLNADNSDKNGFGADEITKRAINFLHKNNGKFFLWLHHFNPHYPYSPPAPYNKKFISGNLYKQNKSATNLKNNTDRELDSIAQYDGEINFLDKQIGILLDEVNRLGLDKKTIVILTADHGESFGEHGQFKNHGGYLYDQLIQVPLIIKGPMIPRNKIINQQIELVDIMPTILSFAKMKVDAKIDGTSLMPMILRRIRNNSMSYAFSEYFCCIKRHLVSVRTTGWKLIYDVMNNQYELYNLETDLKETVNLMSKENKIFDMLKFELGKFVDLTNLNRDYPAPEMDGATRERIKKIGYW